MTRQEFDTFAVSVRSKLLALAWRYKAGSDMEDDPEDIVQDSLLTLWRLISEGYPVRDPEAISVKITKNLAAASLRRQKADSVSVSEIDVRRMQQAQKRQEHPCRIFRIPWRFFLTRQMVLIKLLRYLMRKWLSSVRGFDGQNIIFGL